MADHYSPSDSYHGSPMVRVPGTEVWLNSKHVVGVMRLEDSVIKADSGNSISVYNFNIRMADGKSINVQNPDERSMREFLAQFGIVWPPYYSPNRSNNTDHSNVTVPPAAETMQPDIFDTYCYGEECINPECDEHGV